MRGCQRFFIPLFLLLFGLIFVGIGVGIGVFGARSARAALTRAEALQPLSVAALEDATPGRDALLEGTVSPRNPIHFRDMVAYVREEYRGSDDDGDPDWREDERVTPRLLLDISGGVAQLANIDYEFHAPPKRWQESQTLTWNGITGEGTKRYSGFAAGDSVMALGTIVAGQEGPELHAELLFGGDRAAYIASQRGSAAALPWIGAAFGGIGALLLAISLWTLFRALR